MKNNIYLFIWLLFPTAFFAQQKQLVTRIDKTKNSIGAEFKITLSTSVDTLSKVVFPNVKNMGLLEVIQSYPIDTIKKNDRYELVKKYGLTQFDSGKFTIPAVKVLINNKVFFSDSLRVEVTSVAVDTLKQKMYDIKPIAQATSSHSWIWKLVLVLLLIMAVGAFIYWWMKKRQLKKLEADLFKTPIEKATSLLNTLEKKELWQKGEVKAYYSELTDIARNYIEEAIEIPAMESTTSELIDGLRRASLQKKMALSQETIENLEKVLKQADLVKFAKSKPLDYEITEDRKKIERSIITLDKSIPILVESQDDMLLNEMQRQNQLKIQLRKKRKTRIATAVGSVLGLLIGLFVFLVITKGFDYVKDNILGHPTKELLEGDWVSSQYGDPQIQIDTPKVLQRIDNTKTYPKEMLSMFKEMSSFTYGSMLGSFYIAVSTSIPKKETDYDLKKALQGGVNGFGGQDVVLSESEFETKAGVTGIKGYGTFVKTDPFLKKSVKVYFEMLLFKEDNGLQQVILLHQEGDQYANKVADRILKSVELKKASAL
ncbi:MAG: hypothetical protein H7199_04530 [Burkholderiales bacterium]|nr:hypothetical protein [Flavobacterium sp.]